MLEALRQHGVDNWQGWDDAVETYNRMVESKPWGGVDD